ncbi:MAG: protein kinase [Polyangiaceae bacterium]
MIPATREEVELYVMGLYEGDVAELEARIAAHPQSRALLAEEAAFEGALREAARAARFCKACDELVRTERCEACGAAVTAGGYVIERVLVENAHGRMYVARDVDDRTVALKELAFVQSPGQEAFAAFERETRFLRALEHAKIPRFVASFQEGKGVHTRYYLAQELVEGQPLDARLADHYYDEKEILDVADQVLDVLVYLQGLSPRIVHRDIKPANLLRRPDGSIALVDFGAAYDQGATVGSTSIGTFGYMPLEQMAGQVDATTDPYALGTSLLHLLTRREPWSFLQDPRWAELNVSAPTRQFLERLVAADPKSRFASAAEAQGALERVRRGELLVREAPKPSKRPRGPSALIWGLAATLAFAGAAGMGATWSRWQASSPSPSSVAAPGGAPTPENATTAASSSELPTLLAPREPPKAPGPPESLPQGKPIDLDFHDVSSTDALRFLGAACGVNLVVPDSVSFTTTLTLKNVPCDQALEVLLESRGLWYRYSAAGSLLRIAPRHELDREDAEAIERARVREELGLRDDKLPEGPPLDLELKSASLRDVLQLLASAGGVNVVLDDGLGGKVTVIAKSVSWQDALSGVLRSQGLWFRYRENGKILRIAPQHLLDREDSEARERQRAAGREPKP